LITIIYGDGTWSSVVIQTILAGCTKKKELTDINNEVFIVTPLQRFPWTATVARECDDPASPTRHDMHGVVIAVISDGLKYWCSGRKRSRKFKMSVQCIERIMRQLWRQNIWKVYDNPRCEKIRSSTGAK